ncbi:hypothetical protein FV242_16045 [Methylobacterium sp. WL64]|uniref:hypothetical protein n=1 Tax=Methylobacterium sp. WL64 TaxID=2603894 RepID=UPI0011C8CF32|nr:hypothetical protein [Methylobacterium sp. WL64]TXN02112.1 hypothetical protein FV242_16045 [Methylobacterium sp. WL64]
MMAAKAPSMLILSPIYLLVAVKSAAASLFAPNWRVLLEMVRGGLFLAGLGLIGAGLPLFR